MEFNLDALQLVWRLIAALIVALTVMVRLAHESRQSRSLAKKPVYYTTHKD